MIFVKATHFLCKLILVLLIISIPSLAVSQHRNIKVGGQLSSSYPEEPSIVINPKNTDHQLIGANKDNYYFSTDGGETWTHGVLTDKLGVWGDPCVIADTAGTFYFFHLSDPPGSPWVDRIMCQKLGRLGGTWSDATYMGLNGSKLQDKEWAVVDPWNNNIYVTWTQFDQYGSTNPKHFSNIRFSRSTDEGNSWSEAIKINEIRGDCLDDDNTTEGAVPTVGANGEIYVSWGGPAGLVFDKSLDEGQTWLANDIFVSDIPGGWAFNVPSINRCNGMPITVCDVSKSPYHGNIYINWSDQRNGVDNTDIWLIKSSDGGETWSERKRVNDDPPGKHQFFSWMAVDQTNGNIYIVFYDRRNYNDTRTDVYLAVSKDGGESFQNYKISNTPFKPNQSVFFGDYTNIWAHNNVIRPVWARLDDRTLSIWTALVDTELFTGISSPSNKALPNSFEITSIHPNPFNATTIIQYRLPKTGLVEIKMFDVLGKEMATLFFGKQTQGAFEIEWNAEEVASGVYFVHIKFGNDLISKKVVLSK
ncbi:T9SS type A sorting domain-containing protein [candidate division KSB1 bacterium]|nr:T9SS type A sorting domain-containing protein [candidate division KSB1 bacterium]